MRSGWDCERGAAALGLSNKYRFSEALNPSLRKLALLMLLDPTATMADLTDAMKRLPSCDVMEARNRLDRYEDEAIELEAARRSNRVGRVTQG